MHGSSHDVSLRAESDFVEELRRRRISRETAERRGIVPIPRGVGFRYRSAPGTVAFTKNRLLAEKKFWIEPPGVPLLLWGQEALADSSGTDRPLIICEGEWDAASWTEVGASYAVSVPNGAPSRPGEGDIVPEQDRQFSYLWKGSALHPDIDKFRRIYLSVDNDDPGSVLLSELAVRLGRHRIWIVETPEESIPALGGKRAKDASDVLMHLGPEALKECFRRARPLVPNSLVTLADIVDPAGYTTYTTGWSCLDPYLKFVPPELVVVSGVPGAGKSTWVRALVLQIARRYGVASALMQFEDNIRVLKRDVDDYLRRWEGDGREDKRNIVREIGREAFLRRYVRVIHPDRRGDEMSLEWVRAAIREAATRHDCKFIVLDPWNEVEHAWGRGETQATYLNAALRELKAMCREYDVCIIIVAHPDKNAGVQQSLDEMTLYSLDGGAAWNNKADHGIIIGRSPDDVTVTIVKVTKSKDWHTMGRPGEARLRRDEHGIYATER